jgi:hypothetical protein
MADFVQAKDTPSIITSHLLEVNFGFNETIYATYIWT